MLSYVRNRAQAAVLSAASVIVLMQLVLPGVFDFIFDLILVGLVYLATKLGGARE